MLTFITAIVAGGALGAILRQTGAASAGWSVFWGIVLLLALQLAIGLLVRRRVNRVNRRIQDLMAETQRKLSRKVEAFQRRPNGNVKAMQQELQEEQFSAIRKSIHTLDELDKYKLWSFMLGRQLDTMRMVMYFQLKEFGKADKLMKNALMMTAQAVAIKLTRMYKNDDPKLDKFFRAKSKRLKGDDAALVFSLYAWIKLRRDDPKAALEALNAAVLKTDSQVVAANRDRIANGRLKQFSNALLGDAWYSLYLEEPKVRQQRVQGGRY